MATTLYPRIGQSAPSGITLPGSFQGGWGQVGTALGKALIVASGSGQQSTSLSYNVPSGASLGLGQFCSPPLAAQSLSAVTWSAGIAISSSLASFSAGALYVSIRNGSTGAIRGSAIVSLAAFGGIDTVSSEETRWSNSISGGAVSISGGDYLLVEFGQNIATGIGTSFLYADGSTAITSDGTATTGAQSFITCSQTLLFQTFTWSQLTNMSAAIPPTFFVRDRVVQY